MLIFDTRTIAHANRSILATCYTEGTSDPEDEAIIADGVELALPSGVIQAIDRAIKACRAHEKAGESVDCTVFGTIALGGIYRPIDDDTYTNDLYRRIGYGHYLSEDEAKGVPAKMRLVQFGVYAFGELLPAHTAVQLPTPDTYIQQLGHGLPVALTNAEANMRFYGCDVAATITSVLALHRQLPVLELDTGSEPETFIYEGLPG